MRVEKLLVAMLIGVSLSACPVGGKERVKAVTYSSHAAIPWCHMNMGPTGAKAWMRGDYFVVMSIDSGSPAHEALALGDVVIGAGAKAFGPKSDSRIILGQAIGAAEKTGRPLVLQVLRVGKKKIVPIVLPGLGAYTTTWPANCPKSAQILKKACETLLRGQLLSGRIPTDGNMGTYLGGLLMLASGDPYYLDGARRAAYSACEEDYVEISTNNWPKGYAGLLLSEYFLATGDDSVLPKLREICDLIAAGQMKCGTWGHNSPAGGYGALNQPGIICAMALVLARECGVETDEDATTKALDFFGRYAELGSVPYGDHGPGYWPDDNGRSATAGLLMHLAGRKAEAQAFAESVAMSYWMREEGHTGGFFSLTWGPLGAALAGKSALRTFMDYQCWYYNLIRNWKGGLTMLPYQEALTRFDNSSYIYFGGDFTTGGIGLAYALPGKRLRILGAPKSVFGATLSGPLKEARDLYISRDWPACDKALAKMTGQELNSPIEKGWLNQLREARALSKAATDHLLIEVDSNLLDQGTYRASRKYEALKRCLGPKGDARFVELDKRFADGATPWHMSQGQKIYDAWAKVRALAIMSWIPDGPRMHRWLEGQPTLRLPVWEPLSPTSRMVPQQWKTKLLNKGEAPPVSWMTPDFDDREWSEAERIFTLYQAKDDLRKSLPQGEVMARRRFVVENLEGVALRVRLQTVRNALTKVYLNGALIVDVERGQRGGYAAIELDKSAMKVLRKGTNLLAVTSTRQGQKANHLDVGLEINRTPFERRTLPVLRASQAMTSALPEGDTVLKVRNTKDAYVQSLQASYNLRAVELLLKDLQQRVPFYRSLAENALMNKGLRGLQGVATAADHPDWRVRSGYCNVILKGMSQCMKEKVGDDDKRVVFMKTQVPALTRLLSDKHAWVRCRAATALSLLGAAAASAVPDLTKRVLDEDKWARNAMIRAIGKLSRNPKEAVAAALKIMENPRASYGPPAAALSILKKYPEVGGDRLDAFLLFLKNPPEGFGSRVLKPVLEMAAALDPEGKRLVPVLIEAASDRIRYSGQRGNARGKVIDILAQYGEKAKAAIPTLKAILASDKKKDKGQHEAARKALSAMGVVVSTPEKEDVK